MGALGMYQVQSPLDRATGMLNSAAQTTAAMDKRDPSQEPPPKTAGGAMGAAAGGAMAGASYGAMKGTAISPGWGTVIGAGVGALIYGLS